MNIQFKYIILLVLLSSFELGFGQTNPKDDRVQTSKLLLGVDANMLDKGDKLVYNTNLLVAGIDYGVTKNITVGAGLVYYPDALLGQLKIKIGHSFSKNIHGALVGTLYQSNSKNDHTFAPFYALTTIEFNQFSLTFGPGMVLDHEHLALSGELAFVVPFKKKWAFISENYYSRSSIGSGYNDANLLVNLAARLFHKKWFFDFGVSNIIVLSGYGHVILPLPALSANYKF